MGRDALIFNMAIYPKDNVWSEFKGALGIPVLGSDIEIEGFRVAEKAAVHSYHWNQY